MSLLCTLGLGGEVARVQVAFTHLGGDGLAGGVDGQFGEVHRVGTHVGDVSRFVEALCHHHRLCHGEAQLAGGLLLEGRGGEGGGGAFLQRARGDVADGEGGVLAAFQEAACLFLGLEAVLQFGLHLHRLAVGVGYGEDGCHAVGRFAVEGLYLAFALGDEAYGHRLYAAGREGGLHLAPQHGRQLKAHDAVQDAACLLGVHQVQVDLARMLDGAQDSVLGDFVEDDAPRVFGLQSQHLVQVPGDGLSLAVLIGCEPDGFGFGRFFLQVGDELLLVCRNFVLRLEVVVDVDAEIFFP